MILKFKNLRENKSQNLGVVALEVNGAELKIKVSEGYKLKKANHDGVKLEIKESKREKGNITYTVTLDEFLKDVVTDEDIDGLAKGDGLKEDELELELSKGINKILLILMFLLLSLVIAGGGYIYKEKTKQPEKIELGNGEVIEVDKETGVTNIEDIIADSFRIVTAGNVKYKRGSDELELNYYNHEDNKVAVKLELYKAIPVIDINGVVTRVDEQEIIQKEVDGKKQDYVKKGDYEYNVKYTIDTSQVYFESGKIEVGERVDKIKLAKKLYGEDYIIPQKIVNDGENKKIITDENKVAKYKLKVILLDDNNIALCDLPVNLDVSVY